MGSFLGFCFAPSPGFDPALRGRPSHGPAWIAGSCPAMTRGAGGAPFHGLVSPERERGSPQRPQSTQGREGCAPGARRKPSAPFLCALGVSVVNIPFAWGRMPEIRRGTAYGPDRHPGQAAQPRRSGVHLTAGAMDPGSRLRLGRDDGWGAPLPGVVCPERGVRPAGRPGPPGLRRRRRPSSGAPWCGPRDRCGSPLPPWRRSRRCRPGPCAPHSGSGRT